MLQKLAKNNVLSLIHTEVLSIALKTLLFVSLQMNHIGARGVTSHQALLPLLKI